MADITKINLKGTELNIRDAGAARSSDLSTKQDALVSGTNIKTVNSTSLLGSGNISIPAGQDGVSPHIDTETGNWFVGNTDTGVHAQGPTGNVTVSDGVAQISIINDLTTGGSGDALSAEMGKVLGARQLYVSEDSNYIRINVSSALETLSVTPLTLGFNALVGGNQSKTVSIVGDNLTGNVTLSVSGSNMFNLSTSSITPVSGSVDTTVTVTFYPVGSSTQEATISVMVGNTVAHIIRVQGVVALPSLALSTDSLGIYGSGTATGTIYVIGSLLNGSVAVSSNDNDFTISPATISAADINAAGSTGIPVTISRASSATATSATITFADATDSLSVTADVTFEQAIAADDIFFKGGIRYKLLSGGTLEVEHSTGDTSVASTYTGNEFTIPQTVTWAGTDYTVTSVGNSAFYKCSQIKKVVLPSTINNIAYRAFTDMAALQYLSLPAAIADMANSVSTLPSIVEITLPNNTVTYSGDWCYSSITATTMIVPSSCTNPFSRNYSLCSCTIGTLRIETSSGSSTNGMLLLNVQVKDRRKANISKLQVPTGLKTTYADKTNSYSQRWLKCLGWNGTDDGSSPTDTYNTAVAKIEEITVS